MSRFWNFKHNARTGVALVAILSASTVAHAQEATEPTDNSVGVQEIVVTAQKRAESSNKVGMSITAASAESLINLGIKDTKDLSKLVTGFTFTETNSAAPVYTIRGIGYYDSAFAATPAVTVYVDQIPLAYPLMTRNAAFDLERVEVLKGPQGTLFGQNSTGGAVNYIAAKPTADLKAGFDVTVGRFDEVNAQAYLSGPISDTLRARVAIGRDSRGDWQRSYTRPGETRGEVNITKGRFLLDWTPDDRLSVELGMSGWIDKSDTQAAQLIAKTPNLPPAPEFLAYPLAPANARAADWDPSFRRERDDSYYQFSGNIRYALSDSVTLTSLTSWGKLEIDMPVDADGTAIKLTDLEQTGTIDSFNQELRLSGDSGGLRWVVGGNYSKDNIFESAQINLLRASTGLNNFPPFLVVDSIVTRIDQSVRTLAVFGNIEYALTDRLTVQAGARYTDSRKRLQGCLADTGAGDYAAAWTFVLNNVFRPIVGQTTPVNIPPGGCATVDDTFTPAEPDLSLKEDNVSWRVGINYTLPQGLVYANISRGYKAGTFPDSGGVKVSSFAPTLQESVLAYEAGFKLGLFDRRVQLNAAAFYYDYSNKQIQGQIPDPIFGTLQRLVNVPKSRVYGAEMQLIARPVNGLDLSAGASYINSKVTSDFANFSTYGNPINFRGYSFPFTPEWQANADAQYTFAVGNTVNAFIGGTVTHQSKSVSFFGADIPYNPTDPQHINQFGQAPNVPVVANTQDIDAFTLIDLRAGLESSDKSWRFTIWGRNITNKYYWTNSSFIPADATTRMAGLPATYGLTFSYRY